jgi:hypothetical protein
MHLAQSVIAKQPGAQMLGAVLWRNAVFVEEWEPELLPCSTDVVSHRLILSITHIHNSWVFGSISHLGRLKSSFNPLLVFWLMSSFGNNAFDD